MDDLAYFEKKPYWGRFFFVGDRDHAMVLEPKKNSAGLVFFLHGLGNHRFFPHRRLFDFFLQAGYSLYSFDLPGHGPDGSSLLSAQTLKEAVIYHSQKAIDQAQGMPLYLLGYSLGGYSSLIYMPFSFWPYFSKISVIGVPALTPYWRPDYVLESLAITCSSFWRHVEIYGFYSSLPALGGLKRKDFPIRHEYDSFWNLIQNLWADFHQHDVKIPKKIQMIYGNLDRIGSLSEVNFFLDKGLNLEICRVPHETHFSLILSDKTFCCMKNWFV